MQRLLLSRPSHSRRGKSLGHVASVIDPCGSVELRSHTNGCKATYEKLVHSRLHDRDDFWRGKKWYGVKETAR